MKMSRKKVFLFLVLALLIGAVVFSSSLQRAFWSLLVLNELFQFEKQGWLSRWSSPPAVKNFTYQGPKGIVRADLFLPPGDKRRAGILLNHGVIDTGKDDPRLRRLAEILSRVGFAVFIPDFQGMRSFRIAPSDIDEVQAAFEKLITLNDYVWPQACGLFGFSYGAGPTIIAACRPSIRHKARFVVSFGGYYDLKNVLSFIASGHFAFENRRYFRQPQEYGKWVFLANNLDLISSPEDRSVLQRILKIKLRDEKASVDHLLNLLGKEGKNVLALLSHSDPGQTDYFIRQLPPEIQRYLEILSVGPFLPQLQADLILAHGEDDDLIPFTETLRLVRAAPDPRRAYWQILRSYTHVDPERRPGTIKNVINFYLPEGWKLFGLVNQLMKYR